jgi:CubicO group peptidase (beta-lactamase class C family)
MSVTKSVVSALVGIAIDRRLVGGPDATITETLPRRLFASDADVARFRTVTVRHVLGMSALDAPDPPRSSTPEALALQRRFWSDASRVALALQQPLLAGHGRTYQYNDLNPMLATGLIQYAAGKTALEFAEDHLFKPMEFRNHEWMHQDPSGVDNGGYGLRLRPIDMQKFGILYMNGGLWRGQSLISGSWVKESFRPWNRSARDLPQPNYGWFWWTYDGARGWNGLVASGWKGQRIAVFPRQKVIVTMTACLQDGAEHRMFDQIIAFVAGSVHRDAPAPADPANQSRLNAWLEEVRASFSPACAGGEDRMVPSVARKERRVSFKRDERMSRGDNPVAPR